MTTLGSIGYTLVGGAATLGLCLFAFGIAVRRQHSNIAPRCTARPPDTIFNPSSTRGSQFRGHPAIGWMPWVMKFTDEQLLRGVPGTGTRQGGLAGTLLRVDLDGIVLVKFHKLCRQIVFFTTVLCLSVLLPLYWTAPNTPQSKCIDDNHGGRGSEDTIEVGTATTTTTTTTSQHYHSDCTGVHVHIDGNSTTSVNNGGGHYLQTTLANVPDLHLVRLRTDAIQIRLYCSVLVLWLITLYTFSLLRREWKEMLRLRRTYYLRREQESAQSDWSKGFRSQSMLSPKQQLQKRQQQQQQHLHRPPLRPPNNINNTNNIPGGSGHSINNDNNNNKTGNNHNDNKMMMAEHPFDGNDDIDDGGNDDGDGGGSDHSASLQSMMKHRGSSLGSIDQEEEPLMLNSFSHKEQFKDNEEDSLRIERRKAWIPHPEQPDTVPNVEPYSILLGHLPNFNFHHDCDEDEEDDNEEIHNIENNSCNGGSDNGGGGVSVGSNSSTNPKRRQQLESLVKSSASKMNSIIRRWKKRRQSLRNRRAITTSKHIIQTQLALITQKLERTLPQEPGYSSPVAAVTILPCAHQVGMAWAKWYETAAKMRRLRLIRQQLQVKKRRRQNMTGRGGPDDDYDEDEEQATFLNAAEAFLEEVIGDDLESPMMIGVGPSPPPKSNIRRSSKPVETTSKATARSASSDRNMNTRGQRRRRLPPPPIFKPRAAPSEYFVQALGPVVSEDDDLKNDATQFGPEQMAVYGRELAQSASNFCPHGMWEGKVYRASIEQLEMMEKEALRQLHKSKKGLDKARQLFLSNVLDDNYHNDEEEDPSRNIELSELRSSPAGSPHGSVPRVSSDGSLTIGGTPVPPQPERKRKPSSLMARIAAFVRTVLDPLWWKWVLNELKRKGWRIIPEFFTELKRESTYAVVTFTSRQAAAAARQALMTMDANAELLNLGMTLHDVPTPPLADAAAWTLMPCRYLCRPVTVTLNDMQKNLRLFLIITWLALMYIFYTIPLTYAASQVNPEAVSWLFPHHEKIRRTFGVNIPAYFSGLVGGLIWTCFFMLIPQAFKMISYFGSQSTSLAQAERHALRYFWWFMVITAFLGPNLAYWALGAKNHFDDEDDDGTLKSVLLHMAATTPTLIAPTWLNWIIYRFTIILPINFLLQFNTFFFAFLGCNCCSRVTIGGGPGGPVPYRIYVDSGVVLMCTVALGTASPVITPTALAYFMFCEPLLRRNVIFVYRPRYDDGGTRWTFCFTMIISSLMVGQILLAMQMGLKNCKGACLLAAAAIPATLWFQWDCKRKYLPAFENTTLLRTNLIDGWDSLDNMTMDRREEHRRFLVDTHKAAYIPVCIAGSESASIITSTPAAVVPHSIDSNNHLHYSGRSLNPDGWDDDVLLSDDEEIALESSERGRKLSDPMIIQSPKSRGSMLSETSSLSFTTPNGTPLKR